MFQTPSMSMPVDLAIELSALYAVKRMKSAEIPSPALTVLPSLRELAVATLLDQLLTTGTGPISFPDSYRDDMIKMLPPDVPLLRVFSVTENSYWLRRYRYDFGCINHLDSIPDMKAFYCEALLSQLLYSSSSDEKISELISLAGPLITKLSLRIESHSVDLGSIFSRLPGLTSIQLTYVEPHVQTSSLLGSIDMLKPSVVDLLTTSNSLVLRGRTLVESATNVQNPVTPFHQPPDYKALGTLLHKDVYGTTMPAGCLIESNKKSGGTSERLLELLDTFRYIQNPLDTIYIIDSSLKEEAVKILAKGLQSLASKLQDSRGPDSCTISCLDLSFNHIEDDAVRILSKLFVASEKHNMSAILTALKLTANFVTKSGCVFLAKAISQSQSRLQSLALNGNDIGTDGYVLLANGVLKAAIKHTNNYLLHLNLANCNILIDSSILRMTAKLIQRTALECIELSGNIFASVPSEESQHTAESTKPQSPMRDACTPSEVASKDTVLPDDTVGPLIVEVTHILECLRARYVDCCAQDSVPTGLQSPCILTLPESLGSISKKLYKELQELNHRSVAALERIRACRKVAIGDDSIHRPEVCI